jgi:hypothetical protein
MGEAVLEVVAIEPCNRIDDDLWSHPMVCHYICWNGNSIRLERNGPDQTRKLAMKRSEQTNPVYAACQSQADRGPQKALVVLAR